jgi:hypothetical protein
MPEPVSTAATAAAAAKLFQTTLLVLYFTTPATMSIPSDYFTKEKHLKADYEATKIWTLQSTSQIPVEDPDMCVALGEEFIHQFDTIGTVTVRAYCMCPRADNSRDICHDKQDKTIQLMSKLQEIPAATSAIISLGPGKSQVPMKSNLPTQ